MDPSGPSLQEPASLYRLGRWQAEMQDLLLYSACLAAILVVSCQLSGVAGRFHRLWAIFLPHNLRGTVQISYAHEASRRSVFTIFFYACFFGRAGFSVIIDNLNSLECGWKESKEGVIKRGNDRSW